MLASTSYIGACNQLKSCMYTCLRRLANVDHTPLARLHHSMHNAYGLTNTARREVTYETAPFAGPDMKLLDRLRAVLLQHARGTHSCYVRC